MYASVTLIGNAWTTQRSQYRSNVDSVRLTLGIPNHCAATSGYNPCAMQMGSSNVAFGAKCLSNFSRDGFEQNNCRPNDLVSVLSSSHDLTDPPLALPKRGDTILHFPTSSRWICTKIEGGLTEMMSWIISARCGSSWRPCWTSPPSASFLTELVDICFVAKEAKAGLGERCDLMRLSRAGERSIN